MFPKFTCPYCSSAVALTKETFTEYKITHQNAYVANQVELPFPKVYTKNYLSLSNRFVEASVLNNWEDPVITIYAHKCPNCEKETYTLIAKDNDGTSSNPIPIIPNSLAKDYGNIVPAHIQEDYREAYNILHLSPKASATLSRRCIQGMIRDFWGVHDSTLYKEIELIKSKLTAPQNKVIDTLRVIGNIGAHPTLDINTIIDIDPPDAEKLLKVIEYFIKEWYIAKNEEDKLFKELEDLEKAKLSLNK